jgi:predicted transcriptional regulator
MMTKNEFVKKFHNPENFREFLISIVDKIEDDRVATLNLKKALDQKASNLLQDSWQELVDSIANGKKFRKGIPMKLLEACYYNFGRYTDKALKRRMGRPPVTDEVPIEIIIETYQFYGTARKAAKALEMSHPTVSKHLKEAGISVDYNAKAAINPHTGAVATYLRNNPGTKLPADVHKISEIVGCSVAAVKSYLHRRKHSLEEAVEQFPDLRKHNLIIRVNGDILQTKHFSDYYIDVHPVTLKLLIKGYNSVGNLVEFPPLEYERLHKHFS